MTWSRATQLSKQVRVTIVLYPGKDDDIWKAISSVQYGRVSRFLKQAIRTGMAHQIDPGQHPAIATVEQRATVRKQATVENGNANVPQAKDAYQPSGSFSDDDVTVLRSLLGSFG